MGRRSCSNSSVVHQNMPRQREDITLWGPRKPEHLARPCLSGRFSRGPTRSDKPRGARSAYCNISDESHTRGPSAWTVRGGAGERRVQAETLPDGRFSRGRPCLTVGSREGRQGRAKPKSTSSSDNHFVVAAHVVARATSSPAHVVACLVGQPLRHRGPRRRLPTSSLAHVVRGRCAAHVPPRSGAVADRETLGGWRRSAPGPWPTGRLSGSGRPGCTPRPPCGIAAPLRGRSRPGDPQGAAAEDVRERVAVVRAGGRVDADGRGHDERAEVGHERGWPRIVPRALTTAPSPQPARGHTAAEEAWRGRVRAGGGRAFELGRAARLDDLLRRERPGQLRRVDLLHHLPHDSV